MKPTSRSTGDKKKSAPHDIADKERPKPPANDASQVPPHDAQPTVPEDPFDESSWESFPASDPPAR